MAKAKIATIWLDGCSGCHMSFLDVDEFLIDLYELAEIVYSPLVDNKVFPDMVDVTLVEGAISSEEDLEKIRHVREHTRILVSLGDCAVTGNVPSMRNVFTVDQILHRAYVENASTNPKPPDKIIPRLLPQVRPVHTAVAVDVYVPGCPPSAPVIRYVVSELLAGRLPDPGEMTHFG